MEFKSVCLIRLDYIYSIKINLIQSYNYNYFPFTVDRGEFKSLIKIYIDISCYIEICTVLVDTFFFFNFFLYLIC